MQQELSDHIRLLINDIDMKIAAHETENKTLVQTRASLQNICKHHFKEVSGQYEKCAICGITRRL